VKHRESRGQTANATLWQHRVANHDKFTGRDLLTGSDDDDDSDNNGFITKSYNEAAMRAEKTAAMKSRLKARLEARHAKLGISKRKGGGGDLSPVASTPDGGRGLKRKILTFMDTQHPNPNPNPNWRKIPTFMDTQPKKGRQKNAKQANAQPNDKSKTTGKGARLPRPRAEPTETDREIGEIELDMRRLRDEIAAMNRSPNKKQKKKGGMLILGDDASSEQRKELKRVEKRYIDLKAQRDMERAAGRDGDGATVDHDPALLAGMGLGVSWEASGNMFAM